MSKNGFSAVFLLKGFFNVRKWFFPQVVREDVRERVSSQNLRL